MGTHDIVQAIATDIDLSDNQAYGKAREAPDKAMPQEAGQTTELYDYIPNTLFQGHPPGAQTSAMDDSKGVGSHFWMLCICLANSQFLVTTLLWCGFNVIFITF